ncbi:NAD(P)/FAD-dependent oxidoreductase [Ectothiorhodospiraceae bacterium BW-2]|nr:NAD(P)/FAD-dependent oxidoreductase [Ectothiorhodospiraceae bacterium BW-2]
MASKTIAVLGSGFAALTAVKTLRRLDPALNITLVAPKAEFVYLPSLIWIPSHIRRPEQLQIPLDNFLRRHKITLHTGSVTGLAKRGRQVTTTTGDLDCDGVIIATGGQFIKKIPGIEHTITPCEGIEAAVKIEQQLSSMSQGSIAIGFASNPNEPTAMRGGPMFEFAFGLDTLLKQQQKRDKFKLTFFSPAPKPGIRLGEKAYHGIVTEMKKRQIEMRFGNKIKAFEPGKVIDEQGEFSADLILFMPGMTGNRWFDQTELPRSAGGLLQTDQYGKVPGWETLYVAGDSGSFPGPDWMPKQAHMADLQAQAAAKNLLAELEGKPISAAPEPELICIVDTNREGMFVLRTPKRNIVLPPMRVMHWIKRLYEWWYLRQYR